MDFNGWAPAAARRAAIYISIVTSLVVAHGSRARGAVVPFIGGPTFTQGVGGYRNPQIHLPSPTTNLVATGVGFGNAERFDGTPSVTVRAVRFNAGGATELGGLADPVGGGASFVYSVNRFGSAVGSANRIEQFGFPQGTRAVYWGAGTTAAFELANLGTVGNSTTSEASAINNTGMIAGWAMKYGAGNQQLGMRAVRWVTKDSPATELQPINTLNSGVGESLARAINDGGTVVGSGNIYSVTGQLKGTRAIRWDAGSVTATPLGDLATGDDAANAYAGAVNASGTAVGASMKTSAHVQLGSRPVRWDAQSSAAVELGILGTAADGSTDGFAEAINDSGTVAGTVYKYGSDHAIQGYRAMRWSTGGSGNEIAQELGVLSYFGNISNSRARGINSAGTIVGEASIFDDTGHTVLHAAAWLPDDNAALDLNTLIAPNSGWVLNFATAVTDDNWVHGVGTFDPDGPGGAQPYFRLFIMQVPEPSMTVAAVMLAFGTLFRRRRS